MTECMFHSGDDCPAARELADLDRQINLRMKAEAELKRLREALEDMSKTLAVMSHQSKTTEATYVDGDTEFAYNWFCDESRHVYNQVRAAITQEPQDVL
jgi:hypothetical protein